MHLHLQIRIPFWGLSLTWFKHVSLSFRVLSIASCAHANSLRVRPGALGQSERHAPPVPIRTPERSSRQSTRNRSWDCPCPFWFEGISIMASGWIVERAGWQQYNDKVDIKKRDGVNKTQQDYARFFCLLALRNLNKMCFWKPPTASQFKMIDGSDHYRVKKSLVLRQFLCWRLRIKGQII